MNWNCKKCGTSLEQQLEKCWKCGATRNGLSDASFRIADSYSESMLAEMSNPSGAVAEPLTPPVRKFLPATVALLIVCSIWGWYYFAWVKPRGHSENISQLINSLVARRPADITRGQWGSAVAWTLNLDANSLLMFEVDGPTIVAFEERLREKLEGNVDMQTIHWIWNEYANACPHGASYQRHKTQMLEEIKNAGPNDDSWGMNVP